jgi:hypothetical protein
MEGLLRLVEVVARIQASQTLLQKESAACLSKSSPPVCPSTSRIAVAHPATNKPQAPSLDPQPNAGEPDGCFPDEGARP